MKHYPNLDSLRGLAALAVIGFHCHVLRCGWIGVQFFFVLSGFLITSILCEQRSSTPALRFYLRRFFARRILRLVPLYALFVATIAIGFFITRKPADFPRAAPYLLTYSLNLARMIPGFPSPLVFSHLWSLGVEWQFYLVWPFVIWRAAPRTIPVLLVALVVITPMMRFVQAGIIAGSWWPFDLAPAQLLEIGNSIYNAPWSHFDAFALGGLLGFPALRKIFTRPTVTCLLLGGAVVLGAMVLIAAQGTLSFDTLGFPGNLPRFGQFVWGFSILNVAAAVLLAHVIEDKPVARWITERRSLHYLGKISYGIYVWHTCVVGWFDASMMARGNRYHPINLLNFLVIVALTVAIAHFSYSLFEARFLKLKRRFSGNAVSARNPSPVAHV